MFNNTGSTCEGTPGQFHCTTGEQQNGHKPIEIYAFIDPLCPECWGLEPFMKKLLLEYGQYFTLRYLIVGRLDSSDRKVVKKIADQWEKIAGLTGMSCDGDVWYNFPPSSYKISVAIKAAELQGKPAGFRFLRRVREKLFLEKQNINADAVLLDCAKTAKLDIEEFEKDISSNGPIKSLQCDRRMACEMDVSSFPTLVFFNADIEKEGIKVTGRYPFDVYVQILSEMLGEKPVPKEPPELEAFLKKYHLVATKELAVVYNLSEQEVRREMKKLKLKQVVEAVPVKYGTFWRYNGE
ncbi:putative DsbA family dithiol-disulfide isomerase [Scopulibacillus darangshiensis]|uniref:ClpXP adapter protein SpxH n=2 Tax=Scopulibacillus darangshiensis TaxID=442528 RepID=A0A4V2SN43_9BACL|nr:putative DsbA family dithiol-disulfide isomerase [Scopulibacillus darangshiensis]